MKSTCIMILTSIFGMTLGTFTKLADFADARPDEDASVNAGASGNPYGKWKNGPSSDSSYFPIAVWLQEPSLAPKYKAAGINLYVGLWKGPTEAQLEVLQRAKMPVICSQNEVGLKHKNEPIIIGWMHGDEPDNAQALGNGKGYGPPILPQKIYEDYKGLHTADPSRPVLLNLGQGVAWDNWHGRGVRKNKPEDYPEYIKGSDIVSFDIYPVVHGSPEVQGKLWYVPYGVGRLRKWSDDKKIVWNCIECTRIKSPDKKPTPQQVKAEVWMSIIHGSMGLIYFVHEWEPRFNAHALLDDPDMLKAVSAINEEIHHLAPVLNSPSIENNAIVESSAKEIPIDIMVKKSSGADAATYLFAVCMRDSETRGTFTIKKLKGKTQIEVMGENRTIEAMNGKFDDNFKPWDVHIYRTR
ncbi:hypothetical protein H8E77_07920 [bacterium]|nr:hypothetical protein [bacterium]